MTQRRTLERRHDRRRGDDVDGVTADFPPENVDADKDAFCDDVYGATADVAPENVDAEKDSFPIGHNEIAASDDTISPTTTRSKNSVQGHDVDNRVSNTLNKLRSRNVFRKNDSISFNYNMLVS